jgi:hypothetical protein
MPPLNSGAARSRPWSLLSLLQPAPATHRSPLAIIGQRKSDPDEDEETADVAIEPRYGRRGNFASSAARRSRLSAGQRSEAR